MGGGAPPASSSSSSSATAQVPKKDDGPSSHCSLWLGCQEVIVDDEPASSSSASSSAAMRVARGKQAGDVVEIALHPEVLNPIKHGQTGEDGQPSITNSLPGLIED